MVFLLFLQVHHLASEEGKGRQESHTSLSLGYWPNLVSGVDVTALISRSLLLLSLPAPLSGNE